jgi:hypothetical protein
MHGSVPTLPEELEPAEDIDCVLPTGRAVSLRAYRVGFKPCHERPAIGMDRIYSSRPLVLVDKQATFPEIAALGLFRRQGWQGAWADTRHHKYFDKMPNQSKGVSLGTHAAQTVARISEANASSRDGCWDLMLWAERSMLFVAVVAAGSERGIGEARARWLAAALRTGLSASQFIVVEWQPRAVVVKRRPRPPVNAQEPKPSP